MEKARITIDGNNFSDIESFYDEIDRVTTKDLSWETGHNLNAFNDLLRGGFGVYEYGDPVIIVWINFDKSRKDLGEDLAQLVEIIKDHKHIEFEIIN